ncbi:hypothetical protein QJS04_geneDACA015220 [Acorus gramineus]|uniref:Uncharacterized protein n=1 Tax=Acorus gramineus TaxID=55184 RepID=A0AAV9B809_ACOGR|nr:hypothetical protein QJS04_geneDACA015220 [Acorus gramineus]
MCANVNGARWVRAYFSASLQVPICSNSRNCNPWSFSSRVDLFLRSFSRLAIAQIKAGWRSLKVIDQRILCISRNADLKALASGSWASFEK